MLKPINLYGIFFFEDLGKLTALMFQNLIPILLIGSIFITVPKPASAMAFLLFIVSLIMAYLIHWLLAACFSMWAFVTINMTPLLQVKKHLIRLLSGSIIPLWFFPDWLASVLNCLPFVYIYQLPLDIYIGKETMENLILRLGIQTVWVVVLLVVFVVLQKNAVRKVMVQGG
jgi:ABC-2 type transport system permease protein